MDVPTGLAGSVTIICLVGLGIFLYPWLLARRGGALVVLALTAGLTALFYLFDNAAGTEAATAAGLALLWALAPVGTALIVKRGQGRKQASGR
jgi:hypothetical protein